MSYTVGILVFAALFVGSIVGYWIVTRSLRDPHRNYVNGDDAQSRPQLENA